MTELSIFLLFLFLYVSYIHWTNWTENAYMGLTRSIVDRNTLDIDAYANITGDRAYTEGHYYIAKEPGISLLSSPVYTVLRSVIPDGGPSEVIKDSSGMGTIIYANPGDFTLNLMIALIVFSSSVFGALTVLLVYKICRAVGDETVSKIVAVIVGLGSLVFPYSLVYYSHSLSTFLVFLFGYILFKQGTKNRLYVVMAFVLAGLSVVVDLISIIPIIVLSAIYAKRLLTDRTFVLAALSFLVGALPLLCYNYVLFGSPLIFARAYMDSDIWKIGTVERATMGFGSFQPTILLKTLFDPYRGLFYYYPFLLLAFIGAFMAKKKYGAHTYVPIAMIILTALMLGFRVDWHGGASFGPRFFSFVMPFVSIPLVYSISKTSRKIALLVVLPLVLLSVSSNIIGLQNWEWDIGRTGSPQISEEFKSIALSLSPMPNVLATHYMPLMLDYGPRSRIMENLANGYFSDIDIRDLPLSKPPSFPFANVDQQTLICLNYLPLMLFSVGVFFLLKTSLNKNEAGLHVEELD
jgi:hypothetical protein